MNELIIVENELPVIDFNTESELVILDKQEKNIKEAKAKIMDKLLKEMEEKNITKIDTPILTINYIAPTERETFDSKKLREDNPSLYDEYVKFSGVKSSVRLKVKDGNMEN